MSQRTLNISIVIIGKICSGKSTLAKYLSDMYNLPIASFGGFIREYFYKNNFRIERKSLQDAGETFIQTDPTSFLNNVLNYSAEGSKKVIFEGVRHKIIFNEIKKISHISRFIFVEADLVTRYNRCINRNKNIDEGKSFEQFKIEDNHTVENEIEGLRGFCDLIINTTSDYKEEVNKFISSILQ